MNSIVNISSAAELKIEAYLEIGLSTLSVSDIRSDLQREGFSDADIREIISKVDDLKLEQQLKIQKIEFKLSQRNMGIVLLIIGAFVFSFMLAFRAFGLLGTIVYILAGGFILSGLFMLLVPQKLRISSSKARMGRRISR